MQPVRVVLDNMAFATENNYKQGDQYAAESLQFKWSKMIIMEHWEACWTILMISKNKHTGQNGLLDWPKLVGGIADYALQTISIRPWF